MILRKTIAFLGIVTTAAAQIVTGQLGNAEQNLQNPAGAAYQAILPQDGPVQGSIVAVTNKDHGVDFAVNFENLPKEGGPFSFHLHVDPVPPDGNCSGTLAHLDPYIRGEMPVCDPTHPEACQVGDLSGKYGKANGTSHNASFVDTFVSLTPGIGAFFGNRSFVIHYANTTRITCANFTWIGETGVNGTNSSSTSGSSSPKATATKTVTESVSAASATGTGRGSSTTSPAAAVQNGVTTRILTPAPLLLLTAMLMWSLGI